MKAVYGLYSDPATAQRVVEGLRAAGVPDRQITVISSEPFEEYEFSHRDKATWIYWIASLGGLLGLCFGYWLTATTQQLWPIDTGGMPIVALWPNLIVIFELTMLGGILATVLTLLISARIPTWRPRLHDPEVSDGKILVGVENPQDASVEALKSALNANGNGRLKTI